MSPSLPLLFLSCVLSVILTLTLAHSHTLSFSDPATIIASFAQLARHSLRAKPLLASIVLFPIVAFLIVRKVSQAHSQPRINSDIRPVTHYAPATAGRDSDSVCDVAIIGCGIAGATLSILLARQGFRVKCVERSLAEPHRIVGELLQPGGVNTLRELGLYDSLDDTNDSQTIAGYTIILNNNILRLKYANNHSGRSFHNGRFLTSLRHLARAEGNAELVEGNVERLTYNDSHDRVTGFQYTIKSQPTVAHTVSAALTVVADGCLSAFRKSLNTVDQTKLSSFLGLILKDCPLPTSNHGHVILANPTPMLAYPISSTEVRMLIDFPNQTIPSTKEALHHHLREKIYPQLPLAIQPAFLNAISDYDWSSMPNQSMVLKPNPAVNGVLLIGDSGNMRHPLTGGGMTVCFKDIKNLLQHLNSTTVTDCNDRTKLDSAIQHHYASRHRAVKVINILADALYAVFIEKYSSLRQSCFDYLSRGGEYSGGPVRLLSAVSSSQWLLVNHFFSVALYELTQSMKRGMTVARARECCGMLKDACAIIFPLLWRENANWHTLRSLATGGI